MSVQQDRLTFFGVLFAVVVVVIGYLQLGGIYPTAGRDDGAARGSMESGASQTEDGGGDSEGQASSREEDATR